MGWKVRSTITVRFLLWIDYYITTEIEIILENNQSLKEGRLSSDLGMTDFRVQLSHRYSEGMVNKQDGNRIRLLVRRVEKQSLVEFVEVDKKGDFNA